MMSRIRCLIAAFAVCLAVGHAHAQEGQPGAHAPTAPNTPPLTALEKKYVDLSHSKDPKIKGVADRYLNLVKYTEWVGTSGKTQIAKYVSHDPDLKRIKLSVAKGTGKDRTFKEFDIDVSTLNKTCQARLKQIDFLQKKLDELAATAGAQGNTPGGSPGPGAAGGRRAPRKRAAVLKVKLLALVRRLRNRQRSRSHKHRKQTRVRRNPIR